MRLETNSGVHLHIFKFLGLALCFMLLANSCKTTTYPAYKQVETSSLGMVSAAQPLATQSGALMLEKGGNAVDAAVASAFTLSVVEPSMSGIGGRLQAIVRTPEGNYHGIDATTEAPASYDTTGMDLKRYGYGVIGIPGVVAGLTRMHGKYGKLPLATVMAPAIDIANKGFPILKGEAFRQKLAKDQMALFDGTRQYFFKDGNPLSEGEILKQKDLAQTLSLIAERGSNAFYQGSIALKIANDSKDKGGLLTLEDLAQYKARTSRIVGGTYRGYALHGLWIPSFGAITIEIMQILENFDMKNLKGADWASAVNQAIAIAYKDRSTQIGLEVDQIANELTSKSRAARLANQIDINGGRLQMGSLDQDIDKDLNRQLLATNSPTIHPDQYDLEVGHTTHLSTADKDGMMVALTQSLGPNMGSKVTTPGLGFVYAVTLGRYLGVYHPGQRAASHISPFIVTKDGKPVMALGAAGGSRIVTAIIAVLSRVIDHDMSVEAALKAFRVYPDGENFLVESHAGSGWQESFSTELTSEGFKIQEIDQAGRFGRIHMVMWDDQNNTWIGGADPDWEGAAAGPQPSKK